MIMVIGGAYEGKLDYAGKQYPEICWTDGEKCGMEEIFRCGGVYNFHRYIARWMKEGKEASELPKKIKAENPALIIVTDEVGCGIVPTDPFLREYRETAGRICTELAGFSEEVYRVICGIGTKIKG